jgi:NAD-dependent dihydropyrimidine dehydrogenase PreA subunit
MPPLKISRNGLTCSSTRIDPDPIEAFLFFWDPLFFSLLDTFPVRNYLPPNPIVTINEEKGQHDHSMLNVRRDICGYCGCCVSVCPEGALELIDAYLSVEENCTSCGVCAKVCPLGALEVVNEK